MYMKNKNYYEEINEVLKSYEDGKPYHTKNMDWVANRIVWAWKWRKITKEEMEELADRATAIFDNNLFIYRLGVYNKKT